MAPPLARELSDLATKYFRSASKHPISLLLAVRINTKVCICFHHLTMSKPSGLNWFLMEIVLLEYSIRTQSSKWHRAYVYLNVLCMCPQPGGDSAEAQWGTDVAGAGDGGRERGVRDEWRASCPHPRETDIPHLWRPGRLAVYIILII